MIRVERKARPAALDKTPTRGKNKGKTELERVLAALEAHLEPPDPKTPETFTFDYQRYKEDEVKEALDAAFAGKCAYCETYYSASQPMDVEHWRPKGEVHLDDAGQTILKPGYYWLASDWDNLFPSCIDCNRARKQQDVIAQRRILLGKANQFPVADEATRPMRRVGAVRILSHDPDPGASTETEAALLVDPCNEDPEALFAYTEEGAIVPRDGLPDKDRDRALASIRVYALNRSALVTERLEVIRRIDHRLSLIDTLADLRADLEAEALPGLAEIVAQLIQTEATALEAMIAAESPFAGVARFFLRGGGG